MHRNTINTTPFVRKFKDVFSLNVNKKNVQWQLGSFLMNVSTSFFSMLSYCVLLPLKLERDRKALSQTMKLFQCHQNNFLKDWKIFFLLLVVEYSIYTFLMQY